MRKPYRSTTRHGLRQVERLEPRLLLSATPVSGANGHPPGCTCPGCVQVEDAYGTLAIDQSPALISQATAGAAKDGAANSDLVDNFPLNVDGLDGVLASGLAMHLLTDIPALNSLPGAIATLYLDFNGHFEATWGSHTNITTPAFDQDGDPTTFSDGELASIQQIWAQVSEDFAPFNINVTTVEPPSFANGVAQRVVIGGDGAWTGGTSGGISYVNSFTNSMQNTSYVFSMNLANNVRYCGEAASHESGHAFGLYHQSQYSGTTKIAEYYTGPGDGTAPIMGNSYYATRGLWWNGQNSQGSTVMQDDMAVISRAANGFGYRPDDYGSTLSTAFGMPIQYNQVTRERSVSMSGVITTTSDTDWFSFTTNGGSMTLTVTPPVGINNLDATLSVYNASGQLLATADPSTGFDATLTLTLDDGQYYAVVGSHGHYGDVGQYTLSGVVSSDQIIVTHEDGSTPPDTTNTGSTTVADTTPPSTPTTVAPVAVIDQVLTQWPDSQRLRSFDHSRKWFNREVRNLTIDAVLSTDSEKWLFQAVEESGRFDAA